MERRLDEGELTGQTHQGFWFLDMLKTEEKLAIQIAQIYCIEIDDVDSTESREEEVLKELATDTTRADKKYS